MAIVYITLKIMPESPDTDLDALKTKAEELVSNFEGNIAKVEEEPVAFGLKALNITFSINEDKGSTDDLEEQITNLDGVRSVQVTDVRRAIG